MPEIVDVPIADLLLDHSNARLATPEENQRSTALALARQQGSKLFKLADDIVRNGTDPTQLPVIVATDDKRKRYVVLEGNRRVLALKALETPSLLGPALGPAEQKRWSKLASDFSENPIDTVTCVLFSDAEEAEHWIKLRHTGANEGAGLVVWGGEETDRYEARHGNRSTSRQILDFIAKHGHLSNAAVSSRARIVTNLQRLLSSPAVREKLGLELSSGKLYSKYPIKEVAKGLSKVVEDLKTGVISVPSIYTAPQRTKYAESLAKDDLPDPAKQLKNPTALDTLTSGAPGPTVVRQVDGTTPPPVGWVQLLG